MNFSLRVLVLHSVFFACSTALPPYSFEPSSGTNSSTAGENSTKPIETQTQAPNATNATNLEPCLLVSWEVGNISASNPYETTWQIPADVAYKCLKSVPIVKEDALGVVTNLAPYFETQTTINILKDPPSGYLVPGVDIMAGLDRIESYVRDGKYSSEYDFEFDLYTLVQYAHDEYFNYLPDIFSLFQFHRTQDLVSISKDGLELPKLYLQLDLTLQRTNSSFTPSSVVSIDGKDAVAFLQDWSFGATQFQDPDAAYNSLFFSVASSLDKYLHTFSSSFLYPGATTNFSFENGSTASFSNLAKTGLGFRGIQSGRDLYNTTLTLEVSSTPSSSSAVSANSSSGPPSGYPIPVANHSTNAIDGFFLDDPLFNDVAVLSVGSFADETEEFRNVLRQFLEKAKSNRKSKLIIDLQFNDEGAVLHALELFAQLFPSLPAYTVGNIRANTANDVLGQIISEFDKDLMTYSGHYDKNSNGTDILALSSPFNFHYDCFPNSSATYRSWSEFFGPVATGQDNFTELFQTYCGFLDIPAYLSNRTSLIQPFAAKDIVIVSNGVCSTACSTFSEYIKNRVGVRTIVVGGRPQYGPMQGVGAAKNEMSLDFETFANELAIVKYRAPPTLQKKLNDTKLGQLSTYPIRRARMASFVYENRIRQGDKSATPLQFVYEAADCRFFYTAEMLTHVSAIWERASKIAFGNSSSPDRDWSRSPYCVRDSTGHRSSVSGGGPNNTDYAGSAPPAIAKSQAQLPLMADNTRMGWRLNLASGGK